MTEYSNSSSPHRLTAPRSLWERWAWPLGQDHKSAEGAAKTQHLRPRADTVQDSGLTEILLTPSGALIMMDHLMNPVRQLGKYFVRFATSCQHRLTARGNALLP